MIIKIAYKFAAISLKYFTWFSCVRKVVTRLKHLLHITQKLWSEQ